MIRHLLAMHRIAIPARASVNPDVDPLLGAEAVENTVVEVDKGLEQVGGGPGIAWVLFERESTFREVDGDADGASWENHPQQPIHHNNPRRKLRR